MNEQIKIKIIKSEDLFDGYDHYYSRAVFYPAAGDWEEVTAEERERIRDAVRFANQKVRSGRYFLIEYDQSTNEEVFKSAREFKEAYCKQKELEEKRKAEEKAKREAAAVKRKQKQLEKLKKELGEK